MEKLIAVLEKELHIERGAEEMVSVTKELFISKVWNSLYNDYLDGSITGTIKNEMASISYEADCLCFCRMDYSTYNINIMRPKNNNIMIDLSNVTEVRLSISSCNWIDIHLLAHDTYDTYVSIVVRG